MVGSPYQTPENLADDLLFLHELSPQMAGIGPFIPHHQTPFSAFPAGTLRQTLLMVALTRLILPNALLPATTALGTIAPDGRERGVLAGANVVMPNLSPVGVLVRLMMLPSFQKRKSRFPAAISARCSAVRRRTFSLGMHGSIWAIIASPLARVSGDA